MLSKGSGKGAFSEQKEFVILVHNRNYCTGIGARIMPYFTTEKIALSLAMLGSFLDFQIRSAPSDHWSLRDTRRYGATHSGASHMERAHETYLVQEFKTPGRFADNRISPPFALRMRRSRAFRNGAIRLPLVRVCDGRRNAE